MVDCASICACLEAATKRAPDVIIGKPDPRMLNGILHRYSLQPSQIAIVGNRLYTDVRMAVNTNALGILILSGETTLDDTLTSGVKPDIITDNLASF